MKSIIAYNRSGIGDRISVILYTASIARNLGCNAVFDWSINDACGCASHKLFKFSGITVREKPCDEGSYIDLYPKTRSIDTASYKSSVTRFLSGYDRDVCKARIHVKAGLDLFPLARSVITPIPEIANDVFNFKRDNFSSYTIGLHVRCTDRNRESNVQEYVDRSVSLLDKAVAEHPNGRIFLATDDGGPTNLLDPNSCITLGVEEKLRSIHGEKVFTYPVRSLIRSEEVAIVDAIKVLYLLSECNLMITSKGSFSALASGLQRSRLLKKTLL